jgi:hypothetical protein
MQLSGIKRTADLVPIVMFNGPLGVTFTFLIGSRLRAFRDVKLQSFACVLRMVSAEAGPVSPRRTR